MTTIYFGAIEALLSHEDGKGEVAPMSGKDDVPPLASVPADKDDVPPLAEARELKVRPQKNFTGRTRAGVRESSSRARYLRGKNANRPSMHGFEWRRARSLSKLKSQAFHQWRRRPTWGKSKCTARVSTTL